MNLIISVTSCNIIMQLCVSLLASLLLPVTAVTEITYPNSQLKIIRSFILELWLFGSPSVTIIDIWIYTYSLVYLVFNQLNVLFFFFFALLWFCQLHEILLCAMVDIVKEEYCFSGTWMNFMTKLILLFL